MVDRNLYVTCGYCSTGCQMTIPFKDNEPPKFIRATENYPVNLGKACVKGFQLLGHLNAPDRAITPYIRDKNGALTSVDWDRALKEFTVNFKRIQNTYGKDSVAFISTGQIVNEEHAFLGALAKFGMGMIHGDGNTRQCMASAVVAYKQSFGWDAPPFTYKDFEESDVLIFMGSNPVIAHPIMWNRVEMNKNNPQIIVIDPRKSETAQKATKHLQIKPNTDLSLLYSVANILIENDWIDKEFIDNHTTGFEDFKKHVSNFKAEEVYKELCIELEDIYYLAETIHNGQNVSFWWMVGINQGIQGVRTAQAFINLALMTRNIGKPGTGPNSITGQCNAMGARIYSNTSSLLGGYNFTKQEHREKVAEILEIDVVNIPTVPSVPYNQILDKILEGKIKGLWVICTNPAHSWINSNKIPEILDNLEYLVVQDMYPTTETAQLADLILPAAGCGEKDGTFVNSERRIGILQKAFDPPGDAKPDFEIFQMVAEAWGCADMFKKWTHPEAAFNIIKKLTKGLPWDITGIESYDMIIEQGGIQWPYDENSISPPKQERRLLEDGIFFHPDGKAKFLFEKILPAPENPDIDFPFILLTGRGCVGHWHTLTRTGKVNILNKMCPSEPYVEINNEDAKKLEIQDGQMVIVDSRRGQVKVKAFIGDKTKVGNVFIPMHFAEANQLTFPAFDKYSKQPAFKYAAVNIIPKNE